MKIGIFTQPLMMNYGNLLQAYALQTTLIRMGHKVVVINRCEKPKWFVPRMFLGRIYHNLILKQKGYPLFKNYPTMTKLTSILNSTDGFIERNIKTSERIYSDSDLKNYISKNKFDAYVVGSDQVWRPSYSPNIYTYFLDFAGEKVKKISYAASFGTNDWEFTPKQTEHCANLLKRFDAISVREKFAISLCSKYLQRDDAVHVLDPTLLLSKEEYIAIVEKQFIPKSSGHLMTYLLDISDDKNNIVEITAHEKKICPFYVRVLNNSDFYKALFMKDDYLQHAVETWLRGYMDAQYVVTDSFHGCVFSIIFNKPFLVIGNQARGMDRFYSLLKMVGLENRLVRSCTDVTTLKINEPIDWEQVNSRINKLKILSKDYLMKALS